MAKRSSASSAPVEQQRTKYTLIDTAPLPDRLEAEIDRLEASSADAIDLSDTPELPLSEMMRGHRGQHAGFHSVPLEAETLGWFEASSADPIAAINRVLRDYKERVEAGQAKTGNGP